MSVLHAPSKTHSPQRAHASSREVARQHEPSAANPLTIDRLCRSALLKKLAGVTGGRIRLTDGLGCLTLGDPDASLRADVMVRDPRLYRLAVLEGSLGIAEAYARGYWDCDDLLSLMQLMGRNSNSLSYLDRGPARNLRIVRRLSHWLSRNSITGSKRNIAAHYDLSNEFFAVFLDETMTYSAGLFESPETTLAEASLAKYDRLCQLLNLQPTDHVLEIGTGWGGFSCYAAQEYGCRVTTTTISRAQHDYALKRITESGLRERVTLLQQDYRDLSGLYDKIVSIEMIEAVGHEFLPTYFAKCDALLKQGGSLALQAITIPDQRYDRYCRSVDFIQRYVFPGGCLPSLGAMLQASASTKLLLANLDEFGLHYARTLAEWRQRFDSNIDVIRRLDMPERLLRIWNYYFCYCEAAFREQLIGLKQMLFVKPKRG